MKKKPMVRLTIRVPRRYLKVLDRMHERRWPSKPSRRGRGAVIRMLINRVERTVGW